MELEHVTAKGHATIPKRNRGADHIKEGDALAFNLDSNNRIIIRRIESNIDSELLAFKEILFEWN